MKKFISCILVISISLTTPLAIFAESEGKNNENSTNINNLYEYLIVEDEDGVMYAMFSNKNKELVFKKVMTPRFGGGIGRCKKKKKTFSLKFSRKRAKLAIKALNRGEGYVQSLGTLLLLGGKIIGTVAAFVKEIAFNFFPSGEGPYRKALNKFINSKKKNGKIIVKTHCVNRGHIKGEPMYDYVADKAYLKY